MYDNERLFETIIHSLQGLRKNSNSKDRENYSFKCTGHNDRTASAYIAFTNDDRIVVGCRTCGSSYGLNRLLGDLGINKADYIIKDEAYYSRENLVNYIRSNNIGNKYEDNGNWVVDTDYTFDNAYFYTDERGNIVAVKIKYKLINPSIDKKKKKFAQRVVKDNLVVSTSVLTVDQLPRQYIYNAVGVYNAIKNGKYVYLLEGEKDADTLIEHGLCGTSFATGAGSMFEDYKSQLRGAKLVLLRDFDEPGRLHSEKVKKFLYDDVESFRVADYLPELSKVPGEKLDTTDWMNSGHNVSELKDYIFNNCLDIKNLFCLQELDIEEEYKFGIYKFKEGKDSKDTKQLTNFKIDGINIINRVDTEEEFFEAIIRTKEDRVIKRRGSVQVFNDVKKFRDFLNSSDLIFRGNLDSLIDLKEWCFKFKRREVTTAYNTGGIREINGEWRFITSLGAFDNNFTYDNSRIYYEEDDFDHFMDVELPTKEEVETILSDLFNFNTRETTYSIIGNVGAMLLNSKFKDLGIKLNHLAIFGEAGAGKSTIVEEVIMPLLNYYTKAIMKDVTNYAFLKESSKNITIPFFIDEYKPSTFGEKKNQELSNFLRNSYDRNSSIRGNKTMNTTTITPVRPIVILGEEAFWQDETALIERSNIIYVYKNNKNPDTEKAIKNLIKHKKILNKLGKLLVKEAIEIDLTKFNEFRDKCAALVNFKDRPQNTFVNLMQGLELFRRAIKKLGLDIDLREGAECIQRNIIENVLQNSKEVRTQVEKMLELLDEMISNHISVKDGLLVDTVNDSIYLYIPVIYPKMKKYIKDYSREIGVLSKNDFIKQLKGSKYLKTPNTKAKRIESTVRKCYELDLSLIEELNFDNLIGFEPIDDEDEQPF